MGKVEIKRTLALALLAGFFVTPASAAFKVVHDDGYGDWMVKEWASDEANVEHHCIIDTPWTGGYRVAVDYTQGIGKATGANVSIANLSWKINAGSSGEVVVEFNGVPRTLSLKRRDDTALSTWVPADESSTKWLGGMTAASPIVVRLPNNTSFSIPAAPVQVGPIVDKCMERINKEMASSRDPFAKPETTLDPFAKPDGGKPDVSKDPFASPDSKVVAVPPKGGLRPKPDTDQVKEIFRPGFDPVPGLISAPPSPQRKNETAFVGLDFQHIEGVIGFLETLNAGRTATQVVQNVKDEQQKQCANAAKFEAVSQEKVSGIQFDRLTYTCRPPSKPAMNGDLLIATDANRSQSILLLGSTTKDAEIHRRAGLIFAGYVKTYR